MPSKPMQQSLKHLREQGWTVAIVEKWIPPRGTMKFGVRVDVWGFGDILACRDYYDDIIGRSTIRQIALIQTTDQSSISKHRAKILAIPEVEKWKAAGGTVLLHGWKKRPKDGVRGARKVWQLKEESL